MSWALLTLLAVNLWAIANIIDKYVISKKVKNPFAIVGIAGIPTLISSTILILTLGISAPSLLHLIASITIGVLVFIAFFLYFKALQFEEVSRVIPLYSTTIIFTLLFATLFLGELFSSEKYLGIILLFIGAFLISYKYDNGKHKFNRAALYITGASLVYAIFYTGTKYLNASMNFMSIFLLSEIGIIIPSLISFFVYRKEIRRIYSESKKTILVIIVSNILGFSGFLTLYAAVSQGPATLVNSLDLTQGFFVLLYATFVSIFVPKILKEEIKGSIIALKVISIALMFVGAYLVSV